ncbi:hypothetical protein ACP4OV_003053 [Aristida adscensionis]
MQGFSFFFSLQIGQGWTVEMTGRDMLGLIMEWPDLDDEQYEEAKAKIESDRPGIIVDEHAAGDEVSGPYNANRVLVFTSPSRRVVGVPKVG